MSKILWIGIGKMGFPISMNLLKAGNELTVWDTNPAQMDAAAKNGARKAGSLADGVRGAEFIFTMVPTSQHLLDVVTGKDGLASCLEPGQIVIDMSTVSPDASRTCNAAIAARGARFLRTPVNGSTVFAEAGTLTVICSGPREAYDKALPLLEKMSKTRFHIGDAEQARLMKLAVNMMIGVTLEMFAEAAVLCEKGGIDWNTILDVFSGSSIASPQLCFKFPPLRKRDFAPASFTRTQEKDMAMAMDACREYGVYAPVTAAAKQIYDATMARGDADKDFSIVLKTIEAMSGL